MTEKIKEFNDKHKISEFNEKYKSKKWYLCLRNSFITWVSIGLVLSFISVSPKFFMMNFETSRIVLALTFVIVSGVTLFAKHCQEVFI